MVLPEVANEDGDCPIEDLRSRAECEDISHEDLNGLEVIEHQRLGGKALC